MLAEEIKHILAGLAIDFIEGQSPKRMVYLNAESLLADGIYPLPANRAIKVTFEYVDAPEATPAA